jgi:hypothetical protein
LCPQRSPRPKNETHSPQATIKNFQIPSATLPTTELYSADDPISKNRANQNTTAVPVSRNGG